MNKLVKIIENCQTEEGIGKREIIIDIEELHYDISKAKVNDSFEGECLNSEIASLEVLYE
jgi:hypothetical protein